MPNFHQPALVLALSVLTVTGVGAQVSEGWSEIVVLGSEELENPTSLVKDWRYHSGDDLRWASARSAA